MNVETDPFRLEKRIRPGPAGEHEFRQLVGVLAASLAVPPSRTEQVGPGAWRTGRVLILIAPEKLPAEALNVGFPIPQLPRQQKPELLHRRKQGKRGNVKKTRSDSKSGKLVASVDRLIIAAARQLTDVEAQALLDAWQKILATLLSAQGTAELWHGERLAIELAAVASLGLRYCPERLTDSEARITRIRVARLQYETELLKLYGKIQFIGMSVYKEEATAGVNIQEVYIPLRVLPEGTGSSGARTDPLTLLAPGARHAILGHPGSGKSTLLRFLALVGSHPAIRARAGAPEDRRLPILVVLRRYAEELRDEPARTLLQHLLDAARSDFGLPALDAEFFAYHLHGGDAILLLDGLDELPSAALKVAVRDRVGEFLDAHPGTTTIVTSRIVGYESEVRYDRLGFSHHRVAELLAEDMVRFVSDWYSARIANSAQRDQHVGELTRILREGGSRPIRELASNPLLLTIICLVHRIDATLPDERVVLYEKCTETLLNTWHTWKLRGGTERARGRLEIQNRARIEAVAHWMQVTDDAKKNQPRAIVSYRELRDFLEEYIRTAEESEEDAATCAETFLKFVRDRAGLLVEVGDASYSFVHLTFQEYLAATYLKNTAETGGVQGVWETLERRCDDSRWHEVIRLLLGALKTERAQRYLLDKIIAKADEPNARRALAAGGCLLDGIPAARKRQREILKSLARCCVNADETTMSELVDQLRACFEHDTDGRSDFAIAVGELAASASNDDERATYCMLMLALGWRDEELSAQDLALDESRSRQVALYTAFGLGRDTQAVSSTLNDELAMLRTSTLGLSRSLSMHTDRAQPGLRYWWLFGSACTMLYPTADSRGPRPAFPLLLLWLTFSPRWFFEVISNHTNNRSGLLNPKDLFDRCEHLGKRIRHALSSTFRLAKTPSHSFNTDLAFQSGARDFLYWSEFSGSSLRIDREGLALSHLTRWSGGIKPLESPLKIAPLTVIAINTRLAETPPKINITDRRVWLDVLKSVQSRRVGEIEATYVAALLLYDIWLGLVSTELTEDRLMFKELAERTREIESAPLRIARCIRDLAEGREQAEAELRAVGESSDPAYQRIFQEALGWSELRANYTAKRRNR